MGIVVGPERLIFGEITGWMLGKGLRGNTRSLRKFRWREMGNGDVENDGGRVVYPLVSVVWVDLSENRPKNGKIV